MQVIDHSRNHDTVDVTVGESFRIQLSENATTGYRWQLQSAAPPALRQLDDSSAVATDKPGAAGVRNWTFVADKPASVALRLERKRSWEPQPVETFDVTINVRDR